MFAAVRDDCQPVTNPNETEAVYSRQPIPSYTPMHPALVKLVAMLLLVVQGAVALAPGRVLCVQIRDCGTHEVVDSNPCNHCDLSTSWDSGDPEARTGHEQGPISTAVHPADDCGCHVHVPVPGEQQVPSTSKSDGSEFKSVLLPLVLAVVACWEFFPPQAVNARFQPPDFSASDQVRALKTTRLLI